MAWFARLGIFLPPFIVAAFTIFIKPYPEKHHYRVMVEDMEEILVPWEPMGPRGTGKRQVFDKWMG